MTLLLLLVFVFVEEVGEEEEATPLLKRLPPSSKDVTVVDELGIVEPFILPVCCLPWEALLSL